MTVSASSCGTSISNFRVPGSVAKQRWPWALRCFTYSSRLPGTVLTVATIANLLMCSPSLTRIQSETRPAARLVTAVEDRAGHVIAGRDAELARRSADHLQH